MNRAARKTNSVGPRLIAGLTEIHDALAEGRISNTRGRTPKNLRILKSPRIAGAALILAMLVAWSICSGCGIIFAPITVPAAIAANHDESAKGVVVDESGQALDQVKLHIEGYHTWWDAAAGTTTKYEESDKIVNGTFGFFGRTSYAITLTFQKEGYYPRILAFQSGKVFSDSPAVMPKNPDTINVTSVGQHVTLTADSSIRPEQIRVVMHAIGPTASLDYFSGTLSDEPSRSAILLQSTTAPQGIVQPPNSPNLLPLNSLYILAKRDDHGNIIFTNPDDPCGCHSVAELRVRINAGSNANGAGLLRYVPTSTHPFREMREAPASGYQPEVLLTAADIETLPQNTAYFYIFANGHYGKLSLEIKPLDVTDGQVKQVDAAVEIQMAKDAGRNLNDGK